MAEQPQSLAMQENDTDITREHTLTLLTLPAEVRNMIWEFAMGIEHLILKENGQTAFHFCLKHPIWLRTCKQIHNEAWPVYRDKMVTAVQVSINTSGPDKLPTEPYKAMPDFDLLARWLEIMTPTNKARIKTLLICTPTPQEKRVQYNFNLAMAKIETGMKAIWGGEVRARKICPCCPDLREHSYNHHYVVCLAPKGTDERDGLSVSIDRSRLT